MNVLLKMYRYLVIFCFLAILGCKNKEESSAWHDGWVDPADGEIFHSEIFLEPGGITPVSIEAESEIRVGFTVEKGYEVFKSEGTIYMGPPDDPHAVGGSPGVSATYNPKNGVIELLIENTSPIPTKVAIYTER